MKTATGAGIIQIQANYVPRVASIPPEFVERMIGRAVSRIRLERAALNLPEEDREQYIAATERLLSSASDFTVGDLEVGTQYDLIRLVASR